MTPEVAALVALIDNAERSLTESADDWSPRKVGNFITGIEDALTAAVEAGESDLDAACLEIGEWKRRAEVLKRERDEALALAGRLREALAWALRSIGDPPEFTGPFSEWDAARAVLADAERLAACDGEAPA